MIGAAVVALSALIGDPSPLAIGSHWNVGLSVEHLEGDRPALAPAPGGYRQTIGWFEIRAAEVLSQPGTVLGAQLGFEYEAALGVTPVESGETGDRTPVALRMSIAFAVRALTFNLPCDGMLAFVIGPEVSAGGAHWWSDDARFAVTAGPRLALAAGWLHFELGYRLVPFMITGAPGDLSVSRVEHRFSATLGLGPLGVEGTFGLHDDRTSIAHDVPQRTLTTAFGLGLQWRGTD